MEEKEIVTAEPETEVVQETQPQVEIPQNNVDRNFEALREVTRLQKQRIEELEARHQMPPQEEEKDEFADLDPEDYMTVGKAKELARKLAAKEAAQTAKKIVQEYIQEDKIVKDEARMREKFEDYDYVMENFAAQMIKNDPALAYKVQHSKNPAETAYKLAKISDEYEASMSKAEKSPKAEKIMRNSARPTSANAVSAPLKAQADDFSKLSQSEIWAMSQKYARQA